MEPIIKEVKITKTLLNPVTVNHKEITEVNIKQIIFRPIMKRIVIISDEFNRTIIYDGDADFEAHKEDKNNDLFDVFLAKIDAEYKK